jgi:hypothetical protein
VLYFCQYAGLEDMEMYSPSLLMFELALLLVLLLYRLALMLVLVLLPDHFFHCSLMSNSDSLLMLVLLELVVVRYA